MKRIVALCLSLCLLVALVVPVGAAEPMSDEFKEYLNEDGKLPMPSMVPPDAEYAMILGDLYSESGFYLSDWTDDFRRCLMTVWELDESHVVELDYMYDPTVAEVAKKLIATFPDDMGNFAVRDMELVNYWINTANLEIDPDTDTSQSLDNYSGELKALLKNMNFQLVVDNRAGDDSPFWIERMGIASLTHTDSIYYIHHSLGVRADHVIYLPEDTATDADSLLAAAQKRMDDYAPGKVKVEFGGQDIEQFFLDGYNADIAECQRNLDAAMASGDILSEIIARQALVSAYDYKDYFIEAWDNPDSGYAFLRQAEGDCWFTATVGERQWMFVTKKDNGKMLSPTYTSSDAKTDITVSSADTSVPLDTKIRVEKLTEGDEYERIVKALNTKDGQTFDISLHSPTLGENVTKLESGQFSVSIPLPDGFDNKDLAVYYVDDKDEVIKHEVTVENNYAIFLTYHFSPYTLVATERVINSPTGDTAWVWALMATLTLSAAVVLTVARKKA